MFSVWDVIVIAGLMWWAGAIVQHVREDWNNNY